MKIAETVNMERAEQTIHWAYEEYGEGLYALSSFGVDSAVMLRLIERAAVAVPILSIDTGFQFTETNQFKKELANRFGFQLHTYGPSEETIDEITMQRLWKANKNAYHELTKLEPLDRAIRELGATALLSGVRADQTNTRAGLESVGLGSSGEARIHPILGWSDGQVDRFIENENLPRHPLYYRGYGSIGDWTTTRPGVGREGRDLGIHNECGLHLSVPPREPARA